MEIYFTTGWGLGCHCLFRHYSGQTSKAISFGRLKILYRSPCVIFPNGATGLQLLCDRKRMSVNAL